MPIQFAQSDDVRHRVDDGVLFLTIDREEKRNPLSLGVLDRIRGIFTDAAANPAIKVAVVTGAGSKAFASGGDLAELSAYRTREEAEAISSHGKSALDAVRHFPVPVIARLNGVALGGGAELALACDLRFAAPSAKFGFIHGRLCISPSWGGGGDLVRLVGPAKALRLMATAAILDVEAGLAAGVIDLVCPPTAAFDAWFQEQLTAFRGQPRQVMCAYKEISNASRSCDRSQAGQRETESFVEVWAHVDHWKAVAERAGR
jgi:enoyl-CoA hydratase